MNAHWYALYTRPRWEKKVAALLERKQVECYCPLNRVHRRWSDRVKLVEEPLFKSYVFVRVPDTEQTKVRMTDGVINFVYWNGKPAVVKDSEIEAIQRFLDEYEDVEAIRIDDLQPGEEVLITAGPFMDQKGKVLEVRNKSARVLIESLGYVLVAQIDRKKLLRG